MAFEPKDDGSGKGQWRDRPQPSSRSQSPSLAISGVPPDVYKKFLDRAKKDGWFSKNDLIKNLMKDYGDGILTPLDPPPPFDPLRQKRRPR